MAGNCCCLVPVLILVVLCVAMFFGAVLLWHGVRPDLPRWHFGEFDHSDSYRAGYEDGTRLGGEYAERRQPAPTMHELDALAWQEATRSHIGGGRKQWIMGFRAGFARAYGNGNNQASSRAAFGARRLTEIA